MIQAVILCVCVWLMTETIKNFWPKNEKFFYFLFLFYFFSYFSNAPIDQPHPPFV